MTHARSAFLIFIGLVLGTMASMLVRPVVAQQTRKVSTTFVGYSAINIDGWYFAKDSKTGSCWVALKVAEEVSLAPAPADACN